LPIHFLRNLDIEDGWQWWIGLSGLYGFNFRIARPYISSAEINNCLIILHGQDITVIFVDFLYLIRPICPNSSIAEEKDFCLSFWSFWSSDQVNFNRDLLVSLLSSFLTAVFYCPFNGIF
jgi:hypothetical protein